MSTNAAAKVASLAAFVVCFTVIGADITAIWPPIGAVVVATIWSGLWAADLWRA